MAFWRARGLERGFEKTLASVRHVPVLVRASICVAHLSAPAGADTMRVCAAYRLGAIQPRFFFEAACGEAALSGAYAEAPPDVEKKAAYGEAALGGAYAEAPPDV